jgi:tRNA A37 threonylcarbamoyladenosine dehydratase
MKIRNNKTAGISKTSTDGKICKFRSELKTKCPTQYKKSQQVFSKQIKGIERLKKMKMFAKNPKLQSSFSYILKFIEKVKM